MTTDKNFFNRNLGLISENEQEKLFHTSVAIAGAGGDGGLLAERLVRFGIGKIILADPESFEPANINRQFASGVKSFGRNKAEAVAEELLKINPSISVTIYNEGLTKENVNAFVSAADVVVDEIEYSLPCLSVMLHKETREQSKHVFMGANIGWGASAFCFSPTGETFETHFEYDEQTQTINPLKYAAAIPAYFENELIEEILSGKQAMPALSSSVSLVASIISNEIIFFITGKKKPVVAPNFISIDLFDLTINKF
jgi:molybdopterin/thiamine biosynthesis adenylyltransferase